MTFLKLSLSCIIGLVFTTMLSAHDNTYTGYYIYGNEVSIFKPCNETKEYWLHTSESKLSTIRADILALETPYQPIYLKFKGYEHIESVEGYAMQYDMNIHLSEVIEYRVDIPSHCH